MPLIAIHLLSPQKHKDQLQDKALQQPNKVLNEASEKTLTHNLEKLNIELKPEIQT